MSTDNTGLLFLDLARLRPDLPAIRGDSFSVTYGQLHELVISVALNLLDRGMGQHSVVAIRSDDPVVVLSTVLATALTGSCWVAAQPVVLEAAGVTPDLILAGRDADKLPDGAVWLDETWSRPPPGYVRSPDLRFPGFSSPDSIWMLKATSGTTGTPKLVPITHDIAARRIAATRDLVRHPGAGVTGLFDASASAAMTRYPSVLIHGGTVVHSADPAVWQSAGVDLVFGSPIQIRACLANVALTHKFARVHASGGRLPEVLVRELAKNFVEVANGYGSTETNNCLSNIKRIGADGEITTMTRLRDGVTIEVVDAQTDEVLAAGTEGVVRVRTPYLASTYLNAPDAAAAAFRDGWFYPGDLGLWSRDGEFVVTGRINDQFNIGGMKVNALLLDATLQSVPGVRDAICFMMPRPGGERLTAFLSLEPDVSPTGTVSDAKIALLRAAGAHFVPERFLFAEKLPRNANGKPDRRSCIALIEAKKSRSNFSDL